MIYYVFTNTRIIYHYLMLFIMFMVLYFDYQVSDYVSNNFIKDVETMSKKYVISYDIGTTGVKSCLFEIEKTIKLVSAAMEGYKLYILPDGGAEQDPDEWWQAMCSTSKKVIKNSKIDPKDILILKDVDGNIINEYKF